MIVHLAVRRLHWRITRSATVMTHYYLIQLRQTLTLLHNVLGLVTSRRIGHNKVTCVPVITFLYTWTCYENKVSPQCFQGPSNEVRSMDLTCFNLYKMGHRYCFQVLSIIHPHLSTGVELWHNAIEQWKIHVCKAEDETQKSLVSICSLDFYLPVKETLHVTVSRLLLLPHQQLNW